MLRGGLESSGKAVALGWGVGSIVSDAYRSLELSRYSGCRIEFSDRGDWNGTRPGPLSRVSEARPIMKGIL